MTCVIIENTPLIVTTIKTIFSEYITDCDIIGEATSVDEGIKMINTKKPDFILLDIELDNNGSGLDILRCVEYEGFETVIITDHDKYAVETLNDKSLKDKVQHFLPKPFMVSELIGIIKQITPKNTSKPIKNNTSFDATLSLTTAKDVYFPKYSDIIYARADKAYTNFWIPSINNTDEIRISKPLKFFDNAFPNAYFFRVSQSHLINLKQVVKIDKDNSKVILNHTQEPISISKQNKGGLIEALENLPFI